MLNIQFPVVPLVSEYHFFQLGQEASDFRMAALVGYIQSRCAFDPSYVPVTPAHLRNFVERVTHWHSTGIWKPVAFATAPINTKPTFQS